MNKPEIHSQLDDTSGLKRLGGEASDTANRIPVDIGSTATAKINSEHAQLNPDPVGMAGGDFGGRQFATPGRMAKDTRAFDTGASKGTVADGLNERQYKG